MTSQANQSIWHRLTEPHPSIADIERRRQSQLLAAMMLVLGFTSLIASILLGYRNATLGRSQGTVIALLLTLITLTLVYFLNRSGRYKISAYLFVGQTFVAIHLFPLITSDLSWLFFTSMLMIITALLLPWRDILMVFAASLAVQFILLVVAPSQIAMSNLGAMVVFFVTTPVLFAFIRHRDGLEAERQAELRTANYQLREAEASLEKRVAERTRDLEIAAEVSKQITTILDLNELLNAIVERTKAAFGLYHVSVFLHNPETQMLSFEAGAGNVGQLMKAESKQFHVPTDQGLVTQAARSESAVLVNDVSKTPQYLANPFLPETRSELALPMRVAKHLVGVLDFQSDQMDRFSSDDVRVLTTLAEQIAIAVDNAHLFQETESARFRAEVTGELNSKIASAADEQDILAVFDRFAPRSLLLTYIHMNDQNQPQTAEIMAMRSGDGQALPLSSLTSTIYPINQHLGLFKILDDNAEPLFVENSLTDARFSEAAREILDQRNWVSTIVIPLKSAGKWEAIIALGWDRQQTFNDEQRGLLTSLMPRLADNIAARRAYLAAQAARTEIERLYAEQVQIAEKLRAVDTMKSQFLASMSHELRTPLNAILNFTEFVALEMLGPINAEQRDALDKSLDSGRHLLALINDVLDMTKIEAGMMTLFIEDNIDFYLELTTVTAAARTLLKDKPVQFVEDVDSGIPLITGDRRRIRQILLNLLSNACKFTESGSITLSVKNRQEELLIAVIDTGPGIAKEEQQIIFEPFRQTEHGIQHAGGTGLGLPISKRLVEAHGGRLWLESEPGKGAEFYVVLPVHISPAPNSGHDPIEVKYA